MMRFSFYFLFSAFLIGCQSPQEPYDLLIRNALVYDGSGGAGFKGNLVINADTIVAVGPEVKFATHLELDAQGLVLSPGFINMLSWATESLLVDGRAMSDIKQGVTLEVMGEGWSMGPLTDSMADEMVRNQGDLTYDVTWRSLGEYLEHLESKGVSPNVASFVGASTVRINEIGYADRAPTPAELTKMSSLVSEAMQEGAMGVASALIYMPGFFAKTDELVALAKAAAAHGGMYITHMRSEGNRLVESVEEVIEIAEQAKCRSEIYHLKAGGRANWSKMPEVMTMLNNARSAGTPIAANMYNYTAGATGLNAAMPPWVQEGGYEAWSERLQDPAIRPKVIKEMKTDAQDWENLYHAAGSAENLLLVGFKNDALKKYTGMTLAEVADLQGKSPEETAIDLVIEDGSRVGTVYFLMSEDNIRKQLKLPYMTFGSDAGAPAAEGDFLKSGTHPRAYGNVARLLGRYVRDEGVIPMEDAIHKLTKLAADKLKIEKRGLIAPGYFADLVLFNPAAIQDHATFEDPHQYAEGVEHVFVNGVQVLKGGEHTGALPGRFIKGPGFLEQ